MDKKIFLFGEKLVSERKSDKVELYLDKVVRKGICV
jgi:hypothetical protein